MIWPVVLLLLWCASSIAHLILRSPVPFDFGGTLDNSPLVDAAVGSADSDFPCKQRPSVYNVVTMNVMKAGEQQALSFARDKINDGWASHGGGTCQLAVSLDTRPNSDSVWKIIQVFEGGCPITGDGNGVPDKFTYTIPRSIPNGNSTLAWLWYNRWSGSPEVFMNCAPISVIGGADNSADYDTLPNMYVINLPSSECATQGGKTQVVPHPGDSVIVADDHVSHVSATGPGCVAAAAAQTQVHTRVA